MRKPGTKRNNYADMPGCISYHINSNADKFGVSTPDNKLVETIHKYEDSNENPKEKYAKYITLGRFRQVKLLSVEKQTF